MKTTDCLEHSAPDLLHKLQTAIHDQRFSPRTEHSYRHWISRYVFFHGLQNPAGLNERNVQEFLTYLAVTLKVSPAKQNQAHSALDFLYSQVLNRPLANVKGFIKAHRPRRLRLLVNREGCSPSPLDKALDTGAERRTGDQRCVVLKSQL